MEVIIKRFMSFSSPIYKTFEFLIMYCSIMNWIDYLLISRSFFFFISQRQLRIVVCFCVIFSLETMLHFVVGKSFDLIIKYSCFLKVLNWLFTCTWVYKWPINSLDTEILDKLHNNLLILIVHNYFLIELRMPGIHENFIMKQIWKQWKKIEKNGRKRSWFFDLLSQRKMWKIILICLKGPITFNVELFSNNATYLCT